MQLTRMPWLIILISYILLVLTFFMYGRVSFYRDPGSIFFDETRAFEREYSSERELEVKDFISTLTTTSKGEFTHAGSSPSLCAAFLSVRRDGEQYLPLAVASSIQGMPSCERADLYVDVLIAHTNTSQHPSMQLPWLSSLVDGMHGYHASPEFTLELERMEREKDFSRKAVFDYTSALQRCYESQSPWIAIFEDDIIFADGWFMRTLQAVKTIEQSKDERWLFMRLFNQERSTGWASRTPGQNHEFLITAVLNILILSVSVLMRRKYHFLRRYIDNTSLAIVCILVIPTFVVLFFQAGKASMLPPRAGVRKEPFGCCSQGLVFPRDEVPQVKTFLETKGHGQIDMMLDDLALQESLDRYALYPVQIQHLGQRSVRGTMAHEAQAIWSMAFEMQNAHELRKTHRRLVASTYGQECLKE